MNKETNVTVNREYKSTVFAQLFKDKKKLLSLYNALNNSNYTDDNDLEIVTLENERTATIPHNRHTLHLGAFFKITLNNITARIK